MKAQLFQYTIIGSYCIIFLIFAVIPLFGPDSSIVAFLIHFVPFAILLPNLWSKQLRSYQWLSFLILFYLILGILTAFTAEKLLLGIAETALCLLVFFLSMLFIRLQKSINFQEQANHE